MTHQKYGKGWFNESERHRLAGMGIKTGRKVAITGYGLSKKIGGINYTKKSRKQKIEEEKERRMKFKEMEQLGYDVIFSGIGAMAGAGFGPVGVAIGIPAGFTFSHAVTKYGIPTLDKFVVWKAKKNIKQQ